MGVMSKTELSGLEGRMCSRDLSVLSYPKCSRNQAFGGVFWLSWARWVVMDSVGARASALIRGAAWLPPFFNLPCFLLFGNTHHWETACHLSYGNQWKGGWGGAQWGGLLVSFHFQPVSFSWEAAPCPLATDVCQKRGVGLFCGSALVKYLFFPYFFHTAFFFVFFYLELGCQERRGGRGEKWVKNQQTGSIRSNSVYEVFFKAFEETHPSGAGMRPNCSQSLLILPVQSPHWAVGGEEWGGVGGGVDT